MKNNLKKNFVWNIVGTTFSAFNSLFFMIIATRINGVNKAGIFSIGFSLACLFYIIGIYSGRVFQVTDNDKENDSFSYINNHIISCLFMIVLALLFCLVRGYTYYKFTVIMLLVLFKMLEAFSESLYAIIQSNNKLYKVGISLFSKALLGLISFIIVDYFTHDLILSIVSIVIVNLLFIIFYDIKNTNLKIKDYSFNSKIVKKLFKIGFWPCAFTFLNLYLINLSKYAIDFLCTEDVQTIFGILVMPATFVSMFAQFIIHPLLLKIKDYIREHDNKNLIDLIKKLSLLIVGFGIISIVACYFVGIPVLNLIYGISLDNYKFNLIIVLVGAIFYSIATILSNILTACRKMISQTVIYMILSIICSALSYFLIKNMHINGAIYAYLITMILLLISFALLTYKIVGINMKKGE